jgi:hypothetical protein
MGEFVTAVPRIGILEWFLLNDHAHVKHAVKNLAGLGIKELRTGISWADYYTTEGSDWYDWLIPYLTKEFNVLPCFLYTPPILGVVTELNSPPRRPQDYADFDKENVRKARDIAPSAEILASYDELLNRKPDGVIIAQDADIRASFYGTKGSALFYNVNGSFYDFEAAICHGTSRRIISSPPDDWGGRALIKLTRELQDDVKFRNTAFEYFRVAEVIDKIYKRV